MKKLKTDAEYYVNSFTINGYIDFLKDKLATILAKEILNIVPIEENDLYEIEDATVKKASAEFYVMNMNEANKFFQCIKKWDNFNENVQLKMFIDELKEIIK